MYYIMNKDRIIMSFEFVKNGIGIYEPVTTEGKLPDMFNRISLKQWLEMRRSAKHRTEIRKLLKSLGMLSLKGFIDATYGLTLTDTFWVRPAENKLDWNEVSLYKNKFNDIIANSAFLGSIPEFRLKTTSPEYGTDGMLPKCWVRREDDIYLLKGGIKSFWDSSNEPYSEYFASQLADALKLNHVHYNIELYHSRTVSSYRLVTSEKVSMFPSVFLFAECNDIFDYMKIVDIMCDFPCDLIFKKRRFMNAKIFKISCFVDCSAAKTTVRKTLYSFDMQIFRTQNFKASPYKQAFGVMPKTVTNPQPI